MGIRLEDIRPLKASPVFRGISQKDRFELLKEIDARIVELGEGQLLRRAGDKLDFYPVVMLPCRKAGRTARWRSSARVSRSPKRCRPR